MLHHESVLVLRRVRASLRSRATRVSAVIAAATLALAACSTAQQVAPPALGETSSASASAPVSSATTSASAGTTGATPAASTPAGSSTAATTPAGSATATTGSNPAATSTAGSVGLELAAPTNFDEASKRFNSSQPVKVGAFMDSSGKVLCNFLNPDNLVCQISSGALPLPAPGFCPDPNTAVRAVAFRGGQIPELRCTPPNPLPVPAPPTLTIGNSSQTNDLQVNCVSESFGVICVDFTNRHGFYISDIGYKTF